MHLRSARYETAHIQFAVLAACITFILCSHPSHAVSHFGLSELNTTSDNTDSLQTGPLNADWTWHHVYPLALDHGRDWRLNTDNVILVTQAVGLEPVLTLWTSLTYGGESYFPADTTAWKDSVKAVVERYDGDGRDDFRDLTTPVRYWHVEQELGWWGSTWAQYSQHLGITRRAILSADPGAKVICAGLESGRMWGCANRAGYVKMPPSEWLPYPPESLDRYEAKLDTVLGGGFYDIVDMHSYEQESILKGKCDYVRSMMYNRALPIWCIEAAGPFLTREQGYTDTLNAQMVVRQFAEAFGVGIPRYTFILYQYALSSNWFVEPWTNMPLTDGFDPYELKPAYHTYQQMTQMLAGWTSATDLTLRTSTEDRDVFRIRFTVGGQAVDVLWCGHDTTAILPLGLPFAKVTHIITVAGRTVSDAVVEYRAAVNGLVTLAVGRDPIYVQESLDGATGVPSPAALREGLRVSPSPARDETVVRWQAGGARPNGSGTLTIYSAAGRRMLLESVDASLLESGVVVRLYDARGEALAPGLYWVAVRLPDGRRSRARMMVMR